MELEKRLPDSVKQQLLRQFESSVLPQLEIELRDLLDKYENDLLDKSKYEDLLEVFSNISIRCLKDFFQGNPHPPYSDNQNVNNIFKSLPDVVKILLPMVPWWTTATTVTTTGILGATAGATFGTTATTGLVAGVATGVGVATSVATGGIGLAIGCLVGYCFHKGRVKSQLKQIKKEILEHWETEIKPKLLNWAKEQIDAIG